MLAFIGFAERNESRCLFCISCKEEKNIGTHTFHVFKIKMQQNSCFLKLAKTKLFHFLCFCKKTKSWKLIFLLLSKKKVVKVRKTLVFLLIACVVCLVSIFRLCSVQKKTNKQNIYTPYPMDKKPHNFVQNSEISYCQDILCQTP